MASRHFTSSSIGICIGMEDEGVQEITKEIRGDTLRIARRDDEINR